MDRDKDLQAYEELTVSPVGGEMRERTVKLKKSKPLKWISLGGFLAGLMSLYFLVSGETRLTHEQEQPFIGNDNAFWHIFVFLFANMRFVANAACSPSCRIMLLYLAQSLRSLVGCLAALCVSRHLVGICAHNLSAAFADHLLLWPAWDGL